jgi:large subunit ribosomal protein L23
MTDKFLIKSPIITEKATVLSGLGKYVFLVDQKATAPEIRKALKIIYNVDAVKVNIINVKPKPKNWGRIPRMKSGYKKAVITLKKGQKLDILPQ